MKKKSIQELTIKDNFMFGAVMMNPENCKGIIERSLGIEVAYVEVSKEKSIVYNPEYKGVRLDVYANDENRTHYNVELQVLKRPALMKRARYYHSQIDMELLTSGLAYKDLPNSYVIFICDFDPFGLKKYRYTMKKVCAEESELAMDDGAYTIFLSTKGINKEEVSPELVNLLEYVAEPICCTEKIYEDDFIRKLQESVNEIKVSREMGARYMTFQELLADEREEGREEGVFAGRIISFIETCQEFGCSKEEVRKKLKEKFELNDEIVEENIEKYWK